MTLEELDDLLQDTRKLPRAADTASQNQAIATIEIARQLVMLNDRLAELARGPLDKPRIKSAAKGRR